MAANGPPSPLDLPTSLPNAAQAAQGQLVQEIKGILRSCEQQLQLHLDQVLKDFHWNLAQRLEQHCSHDNTQNVSNEYCVGSCAGPDEDNDNNDQASSCTVAPERTTIRHGPSSTLGDSSNAPPRPTLRRLESGATRLSAQTNSQLFSSIQTRTPEEVNRMRNLFHTKSHTQETQLSSASSSNSQPTPPSHKRSSKHMAYITNAELAELSGTHTTESETLSERHRASLGRRVATSARFGRLCMIMICLYALFLGYDSDFSVRNPTANRDNLMWIDFAFLLFFIFELAVKLVAYRCYFFHGHEWQWNCFDFFVVITALYDQILAFQDFGSESSVTPNFAYMRVLRIMKMLKILRVVRLVRFFRELRVMLLSVAASLRSLFWGLMLLVLMLYIFALMDVQAVYTFLLDPSVDDELKDALRRYWGSMPAAMVTLYQCIANGLEWRDLAEQFLKLNAFYYFTFILSIACLSFSVLNILTGIFVENAIKAASDDRDNVAYDVLVREKQFVSEMQRFCKNMDDDKSGTVSWEEFQRHMGDPYLRVCFASLGLTVHDAELFFKMISMNSQDREVDIEQFVHGCLRLKGEAKGLDVQALMYETHALRKKQGELQKQIIALALNSSLFTADDEHDHTMDQIGETLVKMLDCPQAVPSDRIRTESSHRTRTESRDRIRTESNYLAI